MFRTKSLALTIIAFSIPTAVFWFDAGAQLSAISADYSANQPSYAKPFWLNIRSEPNAKSRIVDTVASWYEFNVAQHRLDGWTEIYYYEDASQKRWFVRTSLLSKDSPTNHFNFDNNWTYVNDRPLNVRNKPNMTNSKIITSVPKWATIMRLDMLTFSKTWYRVKVQSGNRTYVWYVSKKYLTPMEWMTVSEGFFLPGEFFDEAFADQAVD